MLHVAQISFFVDPANRTPDELLADWHSLEAVARAAADAGVRVTVIQASRVEGRLARGAVDFRFISPGDGLRLTQTPRFHALLRELAVDVFHVHGFGFAPEVAALHALAPDIPILLQDHADRPPRLWRRARWRKGSRVAAGVAFCARAQAEPFLRDGLFDPRARIFEVPESTTTFTPGDRDEARRATGVSGDPALLWVGHLNANKDPLTVLDAVAAVARDLPGLTLDCCFGTAPLMTEVQARITRDPALAGRVRLSGKVPREEVERLMRAADLFVLGSHREGSGYSVIEALACGLPAVVTDIPSFRALVGQGADAGGALWTRSDASACAAALRTWAALPRAATRARARARFEAELSSAAVGRKLRSAYEQLAATAGSRRADIGRTA